MLRVDNGAARRPPAVRRASRAVSARAAARCPGRRRCTWWPRARRAPRWSSSRAAVSASRAPLIPSGWPRAMAPPLGFTCSASSGRPRLAQHREGLRGERLVQLDHVDVGHLDPGAVEQLAGRRHRADAHDPGRDPGGAPCRRPGPAGSSPYRSTARSEATSSAAAPSLIPAALPAVTLPPSRNSGRSAASASSVVSRAGARRCRRRSARPRVPAPSTGTISAANRPAACAFAARSCDRSAKASWSARRHIEAPRRRSPRSRPSSRCRSAAPCTGLTNRQPIVVSCIGTSRPNAECRLGHDERRPAHALHAAGHHQSASPARIGPRRHRRPRPRPTRRAG